MYIAHFEYSKRESERMYFTAKGKAPKKMEFKAKAKEPVRLIVSNNLKLEVK